MGVLHEWDEESAVLPEGEGAEGKFSQLTKLAN